MIDDTYIKYLIQKWSSVKIGCSGSMAIILESLPYQPITSIEKTNDN